MRKPIHYTFAVAMCAVTMVILYTHLKGPFCPSAFTSFRDIDKTDMIAKTQRFPDVLLIGVPKCGSAALMWFLNLHPRFKTLDGEPDFLTNATEYRKGLDFYRSLMPYASPGDIIFHRDGNCWRKEAEKVVRTTFDKINKNVKLLLLVCEPVNRVISWYTNSLSHDPLLPPIETFIIDSVTGEVNPKYDGIRAVLYDRYFSRWLRYFPRDRIHVVDGDKLKTDPVSELRRIEDYLDVESFITEKEVYFSETKGFFCKVKQDGSTKCLGSSKGRHHPDVDTDALSKLRQYFKPHNDNFEKMIGQKFNW